MLNRPTVFVIGAGASNEYGLPCGEDLKAEIVKLLRIPDSEAWRGIKWDPAIALAYETRKIPSNVTLNSWDVFLSSLKTGFDSIDALLETHGDDSATQALGRLCISLAILRAEKSSTLALRENTTLRNKDLWLPAQDKKNWLTELFKMLSSGLHQSKVDQFFNNSRFVVFNYDRCIEHFFEYKLQEAFAITKERSVKIIHSANILHVYGSVGSLHGGLGGTERIVRFGALPPDLNHVADRIRTYSDQLADGAVTEILETLNWANNVVFIGFGFNDQNMRLLERAGKKQDRLIFATTLGLSGTQQASIGRRLSERFLNGGEDRINLFPLSGADIFSELRTAYL